MTQVHPNDMTAWDTIGCRRGHDTHESLVVNIDLSEPHGYRDLTQFPMNLAVRFPMWIWNVGLYPVDGGPYCPAHDAVSETLLTHRTWEPRETCLMLDVIESVRDRTNRPRVLDLGFQVGWYSLCAAAAGANVLAFDAEPENLRLLALSGPTLAEGHAQAWTEDGWVPADPGHISGWTQRITRDTEPLSVQEWRFVKIDIEGGEADALRFLDRSITAASINHILIEVSPVFKPGDHYPDLVEGLIASGFEAYTLPPKQHPPVVFHDAESFLAPYRFDQMRTAEMRAMVAGWHQEDVWFKHADASW